MPTQPRTIDRAQVDAMIQLGFTARQIAGRLGCTAHHVRYLRREEINPARAQMGQEPLTFWENEMIGTDDEQRFMWAGMRRAGLSCAEIAFQVGLSRQAVHEHLGDDPTTCSDAETIYPRAPRSSL